MILTTHGLMTPADLADYRELYDMNPEPITLHDLARELGTDVNTLIDFDATLPADADRDTLIPADDADAIREAWNGAEDTTDPECEARGCDIPDGWIECRRCGAELIA